MACITEPSRKTNVIGEVNVCVVGGSCTGVFAAVRAARLGSKVTIIERNNCFGGVAAAGMVNIWHSLYDNRNEKQIIAGLTEEVIGRLQMRGAVESRQESLKENEHNAYILNTEELKIELDELIREHRIIPYLNTFFVDAIMNGKGNAKAVLIENKDGRGAIQAGMFIDATGDGDLARKAGFDFYMHEQLQPPTTCAKLYGLDAFAGTDWKALIREHSHEFGLEPDWGWESGIPQMPAMTLCAETHVSGMNCANAQMLTQSEMEGRRQIRAYMDILRRYKPRGSSSVALAALGSSIGVRDSYHIRCLHRVSEDELLGGASYPDTVAYGSYRIDVHHADGTGITFKYLDGKQEVLRASCGEPETGKWGEVSVGYKPYFEIPYRSICPIGSWNILVAGRMLDADRSAFGALRVMVHTNQLGEAAGTAAYLALHENTDIHQVDPIRLRAVMQQYGSVMM